MARTRNLKPGFFANEQLGDCDPLARLLFAGLWTIADREGRLQDKPKKIKAMLLPYDDCDVDALLDQLARPDAFGESLVVRYVVDGVPYPAIPTFP